MKKEYIIDYRNKTVKNIEVNSKNYIFYDFTLKSIEDYGDCCNPKALHIKARLDNLPCQYIKSNYSESEHMIAFGYNNFDDVFNVIYYVFYTEREAPIKMIDHFVSKEKEPTKKDKFENIQKKINPQFQNNVIKYQEYEEDDLLYIFYALYLKNLNLSIDYFEKKTNNEFNYAIDECEEYDETEYEYYDNVKNQDQERML